MARKDPGLANLEANERKNLLKVRCADLVQVTAFNEGKMTVDVKPLVKREIGGTYVSPPPVLGVKVANVPIEVEVEGKKGTVKVKISPGDIGVVVYLDLDSDNSLKSGAESMPNSTRVHSGDDAAFVGVVQKG